MEQYINKSAVMAEIERKKIPFKKDIDDGVYPTYLCALMDFEDFLDTLDVKEVDLDKELVEEIYSHIDGIKDTADRMTSGNFMHHRAAIKFSANVIEKVLDLIGLKAQKGE